MPRLQTSICALMSGGLDSGLLLHRLLLRYRRIMPVYVRCGFRWEATELYWLRRLLRGIRSKRLAPLAVVDLPLTGVEIPFHGADLNAELLSQGDESEGHGFALGGLEAQARTASVFRAFVSTRIDGHEIQDPLEAPSAGGEVTAESAGTP